MSNRTSRPLYEQISTQIRTQIMNGELKAGEALPSIRSLAKSLQISVLTVQKAYDLLQTDGFIETTAGGKSAFFLFKTMISIWKNNRKK